MGPQIHTDRHRWLYCKNGTFTTKFTKCTKNLYRILRNVTSPISNFEILSDKIKFLVFFVPLVVNLPFFFR
jgi:hypothetical protein